MIICGGIVQNAERRQHEQSAAQGSISDKSPSGRHDKKQCKVNKKSGTKLALIPFLHVQEWVALLFEIFPYIEAAK
jgi:hypothetical protein